LMRLVFDSQGVLSLAVEKAMPKTRYFAISHIWSGGLGNSSGNNLYTCQVRGILHAIVKASERLQNGQFMHLFDNRNTELSKLDDYLFWIDTLCIP